MRPLGRLRHERPLEPGREAGAAAPALTRRLHLVDDPVAPLFQDRLGAVPGAARTRARQAPIVEAVEVAEHAILVVEHHVLSNDLSVVAPPAGAESCRSTCGPGLGVRPAANSSRIFSKLSAVRSS